MGLDSHAEGAGSETIEALKPMALQTMLVEGGPGRAVIVSPTSDTYRLQATRIQETVESATGVRLSILGDAEVTAEDWERQNVIALGNLMDSRFAERLYRMQYVHADARYPGVGGHVVRTVHDPWGTGTNVLFLGGSDVEGVAAATSHLLGMVEPGSDLVVGPVLAVSLGPSLEKERFARPPDLDRLRSRFKDDSNRNLTRGAGDFGLYYALGGHPDWAIAFRDALYEHRSRPYMGWDDTHMELWYALIGFDLAEESPALTDDERLELTRYLLEVLRGPEGAYQSTFRSALKEEASVRHNHAMLPALDAYYGGHYFRKYYGLKEADEWIRDAGKLFESQEAAFKTECDATAYESTASLPLAVLYALAEPDYGFLSNGTTAKAMDRFIGCMDNRFELSGNGDVYPTFPMPLLLMANWYYRDGRYQWVIDRRRETHRDRNFGKELGCHIDGAVEPIKPTDMVGVRCFPVDPEFYRHWEGPETIPSERRFDKISFRADFDPDRQYLLLDGLQMGSHGHDDVNAIIRFTDHGRVFLVDDSYSEGPNLKDHNAVAVLHDGLRDEVPKAAELLNLADLGRTGFSRTAARDHSGTDWVRSIIWAKDDYFVVIDDVVAREPGEYKMACLWRTLGDGAWEGPSYRTRQVHGSADAADDFHLEGLGADRIDVTAADEEFLRFWKDYDLAEPRINVVRQGAMRRMAPGDRHRFTNLFYASNAEDSRSYCLREGEEACAIVTGDATALVGSGPLAAGGLSVEADLFHLAPSRFALTGGSRLRAGVPVFESRSPVSVELDLETGSGVIVAEEATSVGLPVEGELRLDGTVLAGSVRGGQLWVEVEAGRHEIAADGVAPSAREALEAAVGSIAARGEAAFEPPIRALDTEADGLSLLWTQPGAAACLAVDGEAGPTVYTGGRDGRVRAVDAQGEALWACELGAPVTALHVPGAGGISGIFAGSSESHVAWFEPRGATRWLIQLPPLHPSMRYRAPTGRNDVGAILTVPGERGDLSVLVGIANGWLRCLNAEGHQRWEHFGNARAFDQMAAGDLDGTGQPVLVVTGQPSHFGACYAFSLEGEERGHNGLDAWARVTTQMRLGGGDAVICGTALGNLYRLRGSRLRKVWMVMLGDEVADLEICGEGDGARIMAASHSGHAYCIRMDGTVDWASDLENPVTQICTLERGEIAAGCSDGRIVILGLAEGEEIGQFAASAGVAVMEAVDLDGDGESEVVAALADGSVVALKREE